MAESRAPGAPYSVLAGVLARGTAVDGAVLGRAEAGGDDATAEIAGMWRRLGRPDAGYLMLAGAAPAGYNVVGMGRLSRELQVPVVSVSRGASAGLAGGIRRRFPGGAARLAAYEALGPRTRVTLRTSAVAYVRAAGCTVAEARRLLDATTLRGAVPEPIRAARALARAAREHQDRRPSSSASMPV